MAKWTDRILLTVAPWLAAHLIRWLYRRIKPEYLGEEVLRDFWADQQHVILSFWHDQLFMMVSGYRGPKASVMISASKDGELIARTMDYFGAGSIRGSSTRGGRAAFREMIALGKTPMDLCFTPDGPKGPRHEIKDGVVQLARVTGRPVVPMAFACSSGHRFNSWDRFLLPFPKGRGVFSFGEPLYYQADDTVDSFRSKLQQAMDANNVQAQKHLEHYDVTAV